jgi:3-hydroxyisobutyrate dehydrogenase-like beta-hydroxyacid dehydrogenase
MEIGFVGLGQMGSAMAERLVEKHGRLHVFDPASAAVRPFIEAGCTAHGNPREVADAADIVFACLPDTQTSFKVAFGQDGVVNGKRARLYVEMSTIGIAAMKEIADKLSEHGKTTVDAPVSGGPRKARSGELAIMAAGPKEAIAEVDELLHTIGKNIFAVGDEVGLAQAMKLTNNMISGACMAVTFECLVFGAKAGLSPDLMVSVINASTGRNSASVDKVPAAVLPGTFNYGGRTTTMYKDIRLGLEEAELLNVPMWTTQTVREVWRFAMTQGSGNDDFTTLIRHMEEWAGVEVRSRPGAS